MVQCDVIAHRSFQKKRIAEIPSEGGLQKASYFCQSSSGCDIGLSAAASAVPTDRCKVRLHLIMHDVVILSVTVYNHTGRLRHVS